ncbi:hypothetical protein G9A89_019748 [Geosiphon pyriformis]|nr:hypothetical protein G9A89_019748 [Geosiphon pyriformis]
MLRASVLEQRCNEESRIRAAIDRRIESFESDKGRTIRSVLERPFCKVVLDHLVSLKYVFDSAFSGVMCSIGFNELFSVVSGLPEGKAAGLSGISNKLWKHCNKSILDMLLVLLNFCLIHRISLACSTFDVLRGDNFLVLKGTMTQSPIFAIGSVIKDALKKNRELWLVLQDMWKAYDSVGWKHLQNSLVRINMCSRFIRFFGSIHGGCVNRVMTNFGLTDEYKVHNDLDQRKVFSPLLWCIFYDPLLCEVKRQSDGCGYRLNSHFISGCGHTESWAGVSSFFAVGVFVDDTIWFGSSRSAT